MLFCIFLGMSLALGETDSTPAVPPSDASTTEPTSSVPPPLPDRWLLMKLLQGTWEGSLLDSNRLQVSGWTDLSYTGSSDEHSNLPMGFNYRANEFLLQQNWLRIERTVVTTGTTDPTFGFRSDTILPGSDYRFTLARGIFDDQLTADRGQPRLYGIDPIQFYAEAYLPTVGNGLDIKLGRFFAQYGVEANDAPSNALFSHAYTFIYDPFTHTGLLATLKLTDAWSVQAGLVLGCDVFIDPVDEPTFIGSIKWAPPSNRDSVQYSVIIGSGNFNQAQNFNNPEIFDLVYTHKFGAQLSYSLEGLFGFETNVPNIGDANWFGVVNYLTYNFAPRLSGTARLEFFDDAQGQRTGFRGLYSALTAGLSFRLLPGIIIRPELRCDDNDETRPFENKHGLFTAATDVILRW
ncbi:MAG TPA: outer membrane beta-barrel protein [Gemmataceae bacterium]|nr:outer membrane beta-barrel protein [Gemmataceae bacterium]